MYGNIRYRNLSFKEKERGRKKKEGEKDIASLKEKKR